ncbi:MAG: hypothetical protein JXA71_09090, partial [Chitinispirillaceae bacterium]|nr:hypothetical protein [Chitinispirillaceae bacterium]
MCRRATAVVRRCSIVVTAPFMYTRTTMAETTALIVLSALCIATAAVLVMTVTRLIRLKRKAAAPERALSDGSASPSELQTVFDSITDDICIIDPEFRVRNANRRYQATVKTALPALAGKKCHDVYWGRTS